MNASIAPLDPADRHRPLLPGAPVRLDAASCLPERFPANACELCVEACPLALLEARGGAPRLVYAAATQADACIGCGQCAAVCPSGALHVDGFALPVELPDEAELLVDCWRVPAAESPVGTLRVPCLGGLSAGWLLSLFNQSGERPIRLLERGQCAECPAGAGIKSLLAAITETRMLLFECGVDMSLMPMLAWRPCNTLLLPAIPASTAEVPLPRRGFFRALLGEGVRTVDAARPVPDAALITLRTPMHPLQRMRLVTALASIARRHERPLPARVLPHLSLGACDANGVCAAVCPTGALQKLVPAADRAELRFESLRCIACNQCARVCPERSLRLDVQGGEAKPVVLAAWRQRECVRCGSDFSDPAASAEPASAASLCSTCRKTEALSRGVAAFLRPTLGSDVSQP
jgi:ferredoxin